MDGKSLDQILKSGKYTIVSSIGKGAIDSSFSSAGSLNNVESDSGDEQVGSEGIQIRSSGKVQIRIKFYRRRLADYSRAISEKALIDCLQYAGLICGDSEKEIRLIDEGQEKVNSKEEERTEITIEYPEVDFDNLYEERKRKDGR